MNRSTIVAALDGVINREDGLSFQRLARGLLRNTAVYLVPHSEHSDLGKDATMVHRGQLTILCASLDCTWSKLRSDIERILTFNSNVKRIVFCTPKTATNKRISKWPDEARCKFQVEIEILERTWVVDECLREENHLLVYEVLGVLPATRGPEWNVIIGDLVKLGSSYKYIQNLDVTCSSKWCYSVWFGPPSRKETVYIARISPSFIQPRRVGTGADPAVVVLDNKVVVAWIRLTSKQKEWNLHTLEYDLDLEPITNIPTCKKANNILTRPRLIATKTTIYVMLIEKQEPSGAHIRLLDLCKGTEVVTPISLDVVHADLKYYDDTIYCAVDTNFSIHIFRLEKSGFNSLALIEANKLGAVTTGRWDFAVRDNVAIIVIDFFMSRWTMYTV